MSTAETMDLNELSADDYQKAYVEVAFLLDAYASTIDNIMGGNTAPVGRIAGRDTAGKLPLHLMAPSFETVMKELVDHLQAGFDIAVSGDNLRFGRCIIREMSALRKIEPGGALCRLFHAYLDGIVNGLLCRPVKSTIVTVGDECQLQTAVQ